MPDETFPGAIVRMTDAVREHGVLFIEEDGRITFRMTVRPCEREGYEGRHIPDAVTDLVQESDAQR